MTTNTQPPFEQLMRALTEGWQIQSPVYLRQLWFKGQTAQVGYYFILKRADETELIVVPESDQVRQLLELQRLRVIAA